MARGCTDVVFFLIFAGYFSGYAYLSHEILSRSQPDIILNDTASKAIADFGNARILAEELYRDFTQCWQFIVAGLSFGAFITFFWILALRFNASLVVWSSIFSLPILLSAALYYSVDSFIYFMRRRQLLASGQGQAGSSGEPIIDDQMLAFDQAIQTILKVEIISYTQNETFWFIVSLILVIFLIILTMLLHGLRRRIRLSIALIREASKAISGVKSTLLFPFIPRLCSLSIGFFGAFIALLIIAAGHPAYRDPQGKLCNPNNTNLVQHVPVQEQQRLLHTLRNPPQTQGDRPEPRNHFSEFKVTNTDSITSEKFSNIQGQAGVTVRKCSKHPPLIDPKHIWKLHIYNLLGTLWLMHFLSGITQTTLAGAFASYYWAFKKPHDIPYFAVTASFWRVIRYHLGSIAFGSFLLATVRLIRILLEYLSQKWRKKSINRSVTNPAATLVGVAIDRQSIFSNLACCFRGIFWLLDRFLKYVDRNAYIMMSMYGDGFFRSAKKALGLLMRNSTRAVVLDYITDFVLLISRLLVTAIAGFMIAFVFSDKMLQVSPSEMSSQVPSIGHRWLPIVLVIFGTYFIAKGFFSVYGMAVDTLFMCFLIDCEHNDGSYERPYYMSKGLRRILKRNPNLRSNNQQQQQPPHNPTLATNPVGFQPHAPSLTQLTEISKI